MSEPDTSSETTVAPAETASAPPEAVQTTAKENVAFPAPSFGNGRGSGLARGKRGISPAAATSKSAPEGSYKPTAIQVVTAEREYKNPFTPEQSVAPEQPTAPVVSAATDLPISASVNSTPAPAPTSVEVRPTVSPTPATSLAPASGASALSDEKAELNILPPEDRARPAQSWESSSFPAQAPAADQRPQSRREERPTFRVERREGQGQGADQRPNDSRPREERPAGARPNEPRRDERNNSFRRDDRPGEPRGERRDFREGRENREGRDNRDGRDGRGGRDPRGNREGQPRREPRSFEPRSSAPIPPPTPPAAPKQGGFLGWLRGLFSEDKPVAEKPTQPAPTGQETRRFDGDERPRFNRGGRGDFRGQNRGEYRGGNRGENRGPSEGPSPSGDNSGDVGGGDQRFDGGQRRRRHRGGRGRGGFQGDNRGGDSRPDNGGGPSET